MSRLGNRKHFYEVSLTDASGNLWTGKGAAEGAARAAAKNLAKTRGGFTQQQVDGFAEEVRSLVGPHPRTFAGNDDIPE